VQRAESAGRLPPHDRRHRLGWNTACWSQVVDSEWAPAQAPSESESLGLYRAAFLLMASRLSRCTGRELSLPYDGRFCRLALAGNCSASEMEAYVLLGFTAVLPKPFNSAGLTACLATHRPDPAHPLADGSSGNEVAPGSSSTFAPPTGPRRLATAASVDVSIG
jgi:hypothetical protein